MNRRSWRWMVLAAIIPTTAPAQHPTPAPKAPVGTVAPAPARVLATGQSTAGAKPRLRASGRFFTDPAGRVVILRGVNMSGDAKVPPFLPIKDLRLLDQLPPLGVNVIRLVFIWEAYEPSPGQYDETYLAWMRAIAQEAWARGIFVIVDIHQDGFSRFASRGCGDGFPYWALSDRARACAPDNGPACKNWPILMATDFRMHRSFADFYADRRGVRTRYLLMLQRIASAFAEVPGVIGYDPINEPWGRERDDLAPFYHDATLAIRSADPTAIVFLEGHVTTNCGLQSKLPRPALDNVAYAPHYYQPMTILRCGWNGASRPIDRGFAHMSTKAEEWSAPLFLGEFGGPAEAGRIGDYIGYLYDRLDEALASGAQWNFTPGWDPEKKDGWNGEDFSIIDPSGRLRPNFLERPYPRMVAGLPLQFAFRRAPRPEGPHTLVFTWEHRPEQGETELFLPSRLFPPNSALTLEGPGGAACWRDDARQSLICRSPSAGTLRVQVQARY
jgi:endoglycosylceramidase